MNEADTRAEYIDKQLEAAGWITSAETGVRVGVNTTSMLEKFVLAVSVQGSLKLTTYLNTKTPSSLLLKPKATSWMCLRVWHKPSSMHKNFAYKPALLPMAKPSIEINHATGAEGEVDAFPSPEELWQRVYGSGNEWLDKFSNVPFEDFNGTRQPRYYQQLAVSNAVQAIAEEKQRVLLTLATGTGKTFIAFQIAWKLFKSRWTLQRDGKRQPRILFLADRNILANQAYLDFGAFDDAALVRITPNDIAKRGEVPKNGSVFFTIFQSFMSGKDGEPYFGEYEPDFFDLIIIDECHRGGANDESSWRDILNYFSGAVHLGLTATPNAKITQIPMLILVSLFLPTA